MTNFGQEYTEAVIEAVRDPLIVLGGDLKVMKVNSTFCNFFKISNEEILGKHIYDLDLGQWNVSELKKNLEGILNKETVTERPIIKTFSLETGERTMLINARLIKNESSLEQLILLALEDITAISAADELLLQNNRELEENNKELSSFSYIASHDLQEPLRKIHTFSKLVLETEGKTLSDNGVMYMDRILVSTNRMQQLIDDLLVYSHLSNTDDIGFSDLDLNLIIDEVISDLEESITSKNAVVKVDSLPVVKGRDTLLQQLFCNLIGNALKYSRPDTNSEINITHEIVHGSEVIVLGCDSNISYHKIKVEDNGIGFKQEQALTIFEPFKRLHSKDKYEGSGIGLAICTKIVVKHKGFINAESVPGKGTIFNIYLPLL